MIKFFKNKFKITYCQKKLNKYPILTRCQMLYQRTPNHYETKFVDLSTYEGRITQKMS